MALDVTDATFQTEVVDASMSTPVVVDLWAPWCGPCRQLGPIIEDAVAATGGKVKLAKVNVDESPQVAQAFQVQSIPAVYALSGGKVVDGFIGAQGQAAVTDFVNRLLPTDEEDAVAALVAAGDEASLRKALDLEADNHDAVVALSEILVRRGETEEALGLLSRVPETPESRHVAALARAGGDVPEDLDSEMESLLDRVRQDEEARQKVVDLLEVLGPQDPRTAEYRKRLTSALY